jgi:hypothetical protein
VLADAWVLAPLGRGADARRWARLDWSATMPLRRCRHAVAATAASGRVLVFGGFDGASVIDRHHSLCCLGGARDVFVSAAAPPSRGAAAAVVGADADAIAEAGGAAAPPQEAWDDADVPLTADDLRAEVRNDMSHKDLVSEPLRCNCHRPARRGARGGRRARPATCARGRDPPAGGRARARHVHRPADGLLGLHEVRDEMAHKDLVA